MRQSYSVNFGIRLNNAHIRQFMDLKFILLVTSRELILQQMLHHANS